MAKIDKTTLVKMVNGYKNKYHLTDLDLKKESVYVWFPISEVIDFLRENGATVEVDDREAFSGVRIYFGVHTDSYIASMPSGGSIDYKGYNNAILVSTTQALDGNGTPITGKHADIIDENTGLVPALTVRKPNGEESQRDYATLCPPNCNHTSSDLAHDAYQCHTCLS